MRHFRASAGIAAAAVPAVFAFSVVLAFPDGAPWEVAGRGGCAECHFDVPPVEASAAISIVGLPASVSPGERYPLTVRLEDENLANAGFLLFASHRIDGTDPVDAGRFDADDERVATDGARARSTEKGSGPAAPGVAEWSVLWQAPASLAGPVVFDVWANAGNGDRSPFGDAIHHHVFEVAASADGKPDPNDRSIAPGKDAGSDAGAASRHGASTH